MEFFSNPKPFTVSALGSMLLLAVATQAFAWRDSVPSTWADQPAVIDGRATEWSEMPVNEVAGISFRAKNDKDNLYLLIRSTTNDGRELLSGKYRQNIILWFLGSDHKTKQWGIDLDFVQVHPADAPSPTLQDIGVTPVQVTPVGLEVSTAPLPGDIALGTDLSSQIGRQPVYEISIPMQRLQRSGRSIYMDLTSSEVSAEVKAELAPAKPVTIKEKSDGQTPGHHHHDIGGGPAEQQAAQAAAIPKPIHLQLTIHLAEK